MLVAGAVICGLVVGVGQLRVLQLQDHLREFRAKCAEESDKTMKESELDFQLLCDPAELRRMQTDRPAPGIQGQLVDTQRSLNRWQQIPIFIGLGVLVFLGLPYCWYFVLRRIRELREAIIGK